MLPISLLLLAFAVRGAIAEPACGSQAPNAPVIIYPEPQPHHQSSRQSSSSNSYSSSSHSSSSSSVISSGVNKCNDKNAVFKECPSACPLTCQQPKPTPCPDICLKDGCECKTGYVLSKAGGKCIKREQCPGLMKITTTPMPMPDYCKYRNATFSECPGACPVTCKNPETVQNCIEVCLAPGCVCNQGYLLTKMGGDCVDPKDCPGGSPKCPKNETYAYCKVGCPTNNCTDSDSRARIACDPPYPCPSGCVCQSGYLRFSPRDERCILASECPPVKCTRKHEIWDPQPLSCRAESCEDLTNPQECNKPYPYDRPACVCKQGYYRNKNDVCVPASECFHCEKRNATYSDCRTHCPATCADPDADKKPCILICDPPGCECKPGYVLTKAGGQCILPKDCPRHCDDSNASFSDCPSACPKTCNEPGDRVCTKNCMPPGCVCNPPYLLRESDGQCVLPEQCPSCYGDYNATFSDCPSGCSVTCADPDSNRLCDPHCLAPGCACKFGYVRTKIGGQCVLPEDCSIHCADPHASFSTCPSSCPKMCGDTGDTMCIQVCADAGCVCNSEYVLTERGGKCVLPENCPAPETCSVPKECRRTCSYPNPPNCPYAPAKNNTDGCECQKGYILSEEEGKCIKIEECPSDQACNGDPHARVKQCPPPCPSTCSSPDQTPCKKMCEPIGCACESGYLYSEDNGKCILPSDCPAPVDCSRPYEVWDGCPSECLAENCEDVNNQPTTCNTLVLNCQPKCICKENHFRNGSDICVPVANCPKPELECGFNEIAVECRTICPPQNCEISYTDYACGEYKCELGCDCKPDHLRNGSGICILNDDCPYPTSPICGINEIARDCKKICPPQTCQSKRAFYRCMADIPCEAGCDCVANYLRDDNGVCIPSDECFANDCDDSNASFSDCPSACPKTCNDTGDTACIAMCMSPGCVCNPGYVLTESGGKCVLPEQCPSGNSNTCGPNSRLVDCVYNCPTEYCPVDDSRATIACAPTPNCVSGCQCELNHKKLSYENETCIVSSECPPVECTRQNEVWSTCPECLAESCSDADNAPSACNTLVLNCQPKCICKENYFRNSDDLCVSRDECHGRQNIDR